MSSLPALQPVPEVPEGQPAGQIIQGSLYPAFAAPTFIFITHDGRFALQYWHDWRASSETTQMDSYLSGTLPTARTFITQPQRIILHCRDPRIGTGSLHLYAMLFKCSLQEIRQTMRQLPRYSGLLRLQESIREKRDLYNLLIPDTAEHQAVKVEALAEIDELKIVHERFRRDRQDAEKDAERTIRTRNEKIQELYAWSVINEGNWSVEENAEVIACEHRGDLARMKELIQERKARKDALIGALIA
ncbi:hypothetical protein KVT40_009069 [Elsinoe batatas]|uniref:Uncharacterized protein n=1 Tax=Elsinoe batatas TaxID=2601811 RepID=A0A8K0KWW5_9PEZI|nr:hypothetical protein KVT40_009069 [Elsinoe batatas]